MGGHRRDQSDSMIPLRANADFANSESQELQIRATSSSSSMGVTNGSVAISVEVPEEGRKNVSAFLNFFLLTVIHDIVPREPLPDIVFLTIPQQRWAWSVGDVLSTLSFCACSFTSGTYCRTSTDVFIRGHFVWSASISAWCYIFATVISQQICQPQVNRTAMYGMEVATRFVTYVITLGLTSGQDKILCGDLMFSGHTVVLTIMYFVQLQYTPRRLVALRYIAAPITFAGIAALVVSGGHYTMDVLVAYWLTSHVFWGYHQMFELPREHRPTAPMSRLWWFWLCYWFESDVPEGPLENVLEWPFSKPGFMVYLLDRINQRLQDCQVS